VSLSYDDSTINIVVVIIVIITIVIITIISITCTLYAENARWLMLFANHPATHWDGLCLAPSIVASKRKLLRHGEASLIDLRNYLFSRQCYVLLQLRRPAEICQRSTPFVHNCIQELRILKVVFHSVISSDTFKHCHSYTGRHPLLLLLHC